MLRLAGLDGADAEGMPWVNRLADAVRESAGSSTGSRCPPGTPCRRRLPDLRTLAAAAGGGRSSSASPGPDAAAAATAARAARTGSPGSTPTAPNGTG